MTDAPTPAVRLPPATAASVSVVVPVFNSESTLPGLCDRIASVMGASAGNYEIILVNDGSSDGSWEAIRAVAAANPAVRGLNLTRNHGQHTALLAGLRAARYELTVTLDDDLQNPPEEIPKLLGALADDVDVVYGTPARSNHRTGRRFMTRLTRTMLRGLIGSEVARSASSFRAFRTRLSDAFADYRGASVSIDVLLSWSTSRYAAVAVRHDPRRTGRTNYTVSKLLLYTMDLTVGFSTRPLKIASVIGLAFSAIGFGVLVFVVGSAMVRGNQVPGFPFLASVIAVFSGAQLFALGIIGEYLGRMYARLLDKPVYVVVDEVGGD